MNRRSVKPVPARARSRRSRTREFNVIIERDEDGWFVATVPSLPGCHTQARSLDTLMERVREAIEACLGDGVAPPAAQFVGVQRVAV